MLDNFSKKFIKWLTYESPNEGYPLCDFERLRYEVRLCDVLLVDGRSRVSEVIKLVTQSPWSHACLYIGHLHDIDDGETRSMLTQHYNGDPNDQLVVEGVMGKGIIVSRLEAYRNEHIRICRPRGLSRHDAQDVLNYVINTLGSSYDTRQIFDLARFLYPWSLFPRRWRSTLFEHRAGSATQTVCSTMIAEAFNSINFPILPLIKRHEETGIELIKRNPKLFTPKDFDFSPYFEIIKYPFIDLGEYGSYRNLPWNRDGLLSHDQVGVFDPRLQQNPKKSISDKSTTESAPTKTGGSAEDTPTIESKRDKPTDPKKDPNPGEETPIRSQSMDLQHKSQPSTKSPQEEADNLDLPPAKGSTNHEPDDE